MGWTGVKNYSKVFDLSSWKGRVALIEIGKTRKNRCEIGNQELSFGHVKLMMPIGHPNRCSVDILIMNTGFFLMK